MPFFSRGDKIQEKSNSLFENGDLQSKNSTTSQAKENSQSIHSLLDDLEAKFGSLLAVRNLAILNKKELFDFLLNHSAFAALYTKEFFDTSKIADKNILHFKQAEFLKCLIFAFWEVASRLLLAR